MSFTYNGTEVQGVTYNGTEVQQVTYNGTVVWEYAAPFDHNSYGDRNITTYFTSGDLTKDLAKGNFRNVKVGDYINLPSDAEIMGTTGVAKLFVLHADYFQGKNGNPSDMRHHLVVALGKGTPTSINALGTGSAQGDSSWGLEGANNGYYVSSGAVDVRADIERQVRAIEMLQGHILQHVIECSGGEHSGSPTLQAPRYYVAEMNICEIDGYEANRVITDPKGFSAGTILEMFGDDTEQFDYFRLGRFTYKQFKTRDFAGDTFHCPVVAGTGSSNTTCTGIGILFPLIPYFLLY